MITPSQVREGLVKRFNSKFFGIDGYLNIPKTPEVMIASVRDIAQPTEKIVQSPEFEELVCYWYTHGDMSQLSLFYAPISLLEAHNVLHYFASHKIEDIAFIRKSLRLIEQRMAKYLQAWNDIQAAKQSLDKARQGLGLDNSELHIVGEPFGGFRLRDPRNPDSEKLYSESWQGKVDDAILIVEFYRTLIADSGHASANFESWATRYLFGKTSISCVHINDRLIFPKPWKLLSGLLAQCFVARETQAVRSTIEQFCAKKSR